MWIDYEFHEFPEQYRIIREIRFFIVGTTNNNPGS